MKKAQVETMGLMIIVVLLLVIGLIALRFMLTKQETNQDSYLSSKVNNLANSVIKANLCTGNFEEAIVSCCNNELFCGLDACSLVTEELTNLINSSNEKITFEAKDSSGRTCFSLGTCDFGISSGIYNLDNGVMFNTKICQK